MIAGCLFTGPTWAAEWRADYAKSTLGFIATYDEISFDGRFHEFEASINFDPEAPGESAFEVTVTVASVDTASPDRDEGMLEADWFDAPNYPRSHFRSSTIQPAGKPGRFTVTGNLSLKDVTRPVTLEFNWTESGDTARLHGSGRVKRTHFNIGTGEWEEDDTIGFDVSIVFDLKLVR